MIKIQISCYYTKILIKCFLYFFDVENAQDVFQLPFNDMLSNIIPSRNTLVSNSNL